MKYVKVIMLSALVFAAGCRTQEIVVDPVQSWEGHFMTVEEFREKTADIELQKNQSIWVLSNNTLKRVLKNQQNKQDN